MKKPNVLFIICDDLNDSLEGWGGHPQTKTPNISRLMSKGVSFMNAHCNSPLCGPSRASLLSGLYPHTTGNFVFRNWKDNKILKNSVMLQSHFKNNGYKVYGTGKIHHNFQEDLTAYHEYGYEADFGPFPDRGTFTETTCGLPHPSMADIFDTDKEIRIPWEQTFGRMSDVPQWGEDNPYDSRDGWFLDGKLFRYESDTDRDLLPDELSVEWALQRLDEHDDEKPFFMGVGFNRPHTPLYVPDEYFDRFPLEEIIIPEHFNEKYEDCPEIAETLYKYGYARCNLVKNAGKEMWKKWIQAYLACVSFVDDQVGVLLDKLEALNYADNTVIVFTSDNGYHMGEKGVLFKNTLWDESSRVPYIISAPSLNKGGVDCEQPVSLIDLYPTLIDLCDLPTNPNEGGNEYALDGRSLKDLIVNPELESDEEVIMNACTNESTILKYGPHKGGPAHFSYRNKTWRYTLFANGEEELFNHDEDPLEMKNLASDKSLFELKKQMKDSLLNKVPDWFLSENKPDYEEQQWDVLHV